jgi:hypothetical protein
MIFVFPTNEKQGERKEYTLPKGVKEAKELLLKMPA